MLFQSHSCSFLSKGLGNYLLDSGKRKIQSEEQLDFDCFKCNLPSLIAFIVDTTIILNTFV